MTVHIDQLSPWIEAKLELQNESTHGVKSELDYLASGPKKIGDQYITRQELWKRKFSTKGRSITSHLVSSYFKHHMTQKKMSLITKEGRFLEEILIYDDNNEKFESSSADKQNDMILRSVNDEIENITDQVIMRANEVLKFFFIYDAATDSFELKTGPLDFNEMFENLKGKTIPQESQQQKAAWQRLDLTKDININFLTSLYSIHRMAEYATQGYEEEIDVKTALHFKEFRNIMDSAIPAKSRKRNYHKIKATESSKRRNQIHYELENKFLTDGLISLFQSQAGDANNPLSSEVLALTLIETNHLIDMTDGQYGTAILKHIGEEQWKQILSDYDLTHSVFTTLTNAITVQNLKFYRKLYGEDTDLHLQLMASLLTEDQPWLKVLTASSLLLGMKNHLADVDTELIFQTLDSIHKGKQYPHSSLINVILKAFGELSKGVDVPRDVLSGAFNWCKKFLQGFESFGDADADRKTILKAQRVMVSLDEHRAQEYLFDDLFKPLDTTFNPRVEKQLAHNSYYEKVGGAQSLALVSGQHRLAMRRRLDQSSNEWGRDLEKRIREDPIFRLDVLQEAKSALESEGETTVQKIVAKYDPDGILQRNLAFIHVMRSIYMNRKSFDPLIVKNFPQLKLSSGYIQYEQSILDTLNFKSILTKNFDAEIYKKESKEFDAWLREVQEYNPHFFKGLKQKILELPRDDLRLSFEVFFIEVNEVETYQYYLDPIKGPTTLFEFVGKIRSWTSGYQGRLLTRMQAFFIQDMIRQDHIENPESYKKPEEYLEYFEESIGRERFFDEKEGTIRILNEAIHPTGDPDLNFSEDEAIMILKYFSSTGFSAYLPQWLLFIIDHRFLDENDDENLVPLTRAFETLATTKYPRHLMKKLFEDKGYLVSPDDASVATVNRKRQEYIYEAAKRCLKKLPRAKVTDVPYQDADEWTLQKPIRFTNKRTLQKKPIAFERLLTEFQDTQAKPGKYFAYRRLAKRLLKTHRVEAIKAIVDEALTYRHVTFPANAPLRPWFRSFFGYLISNEKMETSLQDIATVSPSTGIGLSSLVNFPAILVKWADRNKIDLNEAFGQSFENYEAPEEIRLIQEEIERLEQEISEKQDALITSQNDNKEYSEEVEIFHSELNQDIADLIALKERKERERNRKIAKLADDPTTFAEQAVMQTITFVYNEVRKQYLKEALIREGEVSAELIEWHLENDVFPQKAQLIRNKKHYTEQDYQDKLALIEERIEFLVSVLAQVEGTEYFNDFNVTHRRGDKYRRS